MVKRTGAIKGYQDLTAVRSVKRSLNLLKAVPLLKKLNPVIII